ncbi:MAG: hypothetical protein OXC71_10545, partial [Chloroflexi bacterium]|nr:hypothetical protein [Chloroflexota bacterium]
MSEIEREGRWWSTELNRRTLLRGGVLGGAGLAAAALIGCGGDDDDDTTSAPAAQSSSDSATSSGNTTVSADNTTGNDSGGGAATTTNEDTEDYSFGQTVRDESLPYPYQFPEPNKKPTAGERLRVAVSFDFANFDPTVSAAGGTITAPNLVYNR